MKDETFFIGKYISQIDSLLYFNTSAARIELLKSQVMSEYEVDASRFVNGKYWFANPHHIRYLFSPSAFNLKKGDGSYQNIYGTLNSVNFGLTDHFTLGAGTELLSLFQATRYWSLNQKLADIK